MKRLFLILLLVNLAFAGVALLAVNGEDENLQDHQPLDADKLDIVSAAKVTDKRVSVNPVQDKDKLCLEWGTFTGQSLEQALAKLKEMSVDEATFSQVNVEESNRFWVYIPPLKSKAEADKKIAELKAMGAKDFLLIATDGKWKNAISLGVYATEEASFKYLAQLQKKGVKSAKSGPRQRETGEVKFQIRDVSDDVANKLVKLKEDFKGSDLKAVACQ